MLNVVDLCKTFDNKKVLDNENFIFDKGITGVYGKSGIGKSTLAKILVGIVSPDSGNIYLNGKPLFYNKRYESSMHRKIHLINQEPIMALDPALRLDKQIFEICHVYRLFSNKEKMKESINNILLSLGLDYELLKRYPSQISGGEAQRIAILKALLIKPDVVIADESLSMLDSVTQAQIIKIYQKMVEDYDITLIMISHDLECLKKICSKIYEVRR